MRGRKVLTPLRPRGKKGEEWSRSPTRWLGKIASNAHVLIWRRQVVAWDIRVVLSATLVVLTIVSTWFDLWSIRSVARVLVFGFYLVLIFELLLLYFLAASVLPEDAGAEHLGAYYARNAGRFWLTFVTFEASYLVLWLSFGGLVLPFWKWSFIIARTVVALGLLSVQAKRWHQAGIVVLVILTLAEYWPSVLG